MGFLPRDETFFDFFERMAANLDEAARLLDVFMDDFTDHQSKCAKIHAIEHHGDLLTRESIETLNRTFITPFDREEVHELICRLDDVLDRIDEAANRMMLFRVDKPTADARALAKVLVNCTSLIKQLMPQLRSLKNPQVIINHCGEIHKQETEGDRLEQHGLAALFEAAGDPIYIIKWKDIYKVLEDATDKCADVANVVESIVIRNS